MFIVLCWNIALRFQELDLNSMQIIKFIEYLLNLSWTQH